MGDTTQSGMEHALRAISPVDGRYISKVKKLQDYFSEYALIKYRMLVEVQYFIALCELPLPQLSEVSRESCNNLVRLTNSFDMDDAARIKAIEKTTNHDVKAVEYFLKEAFAKMNLQEVQEFIHFGLTSQDINNTAIPLSLKHALEREYMPALQEVSKALEDKAREWDNIPMLAHTHGQPASPTTVGKEFRVYLQRLHNQVDLLQQVPHSAKFGGATGNFNAHYVAYPDIDWISFGNDFVSQVLGLQRSHPTTQIEHYDNLAACFQAMMRINTILIDLCRDVWTYISMDYFKQRVVEGEIGSSAMPHKVNPIDFENAEGNFGIANALLDHLANKLPISRLQRDLTDSTVLRNIGVPIAHTLIGFASVKKGLGKLLLNESKLDRDLEANWSVLAEAVQNVLRREGYPKPYETLKELTRGKPGITREDMHRFIDTLDLDRSVREQLKLLTPQNYVGKGL